MSKTIKVLGISGSLRQKSYNSAMLRTAAQLMPEDMSLEIFDLSALPMLNPDTEKPFPQAVEEFRTSVAQADAVLIASPEYNGSISGTLKNALDWASRPPKNLFFNKPAAVMGASTGKFGTVRSQLALRQILTHLGALTVAKPEVLVANADSAFDDEANLIDSAARGFLSDLLTALGIWVRKVS